MPLAPAARRLDAAGVSRLLVLLILAASALCCSEADAQTRGEPQHRLRFDEGYRRFSAVEYAATGAIAATYLYVELALKAPDEPKWIRPILVDDDVRDAVRLDTPSGRNMASVLSDVLWLSPQLIALADGVVVPLADDLNVDVMWQMTAMNLQAIAVTGLITRGMHTVIGRQRPDVEECDRDAGYSKFCRLGQRSAFPSGHASGAAVGAGLTCAHHLNLPLYGGGGRDASACIVTTAMAVGTGYFRMSADRHYVSDIVAGAAIGFGVGFGLPHLLHYAPVIGSGAAPQSGQWRLWALPHADGDSVGARAVGYF